MRIAAVALVAGSLPTSEAADAAPSAAEGRACAALAATGWDPVTGQAIASRP